MKKNTNDVSVGMLSLAVSFPRVARTNDYFRTNHPAVVAEAEKKSLARVWSKDDVRAQPTNAHDIEMLPYLEDPFRGTVERRVLEPNQTALSLESSAARKALASAGMTPGDVEHLLVVSFMPDQPGFGNAAFLARELGIMRPAWNIESTCAGAYAAFQAATALVQSGQCGTVLVVVLLHVLARLGL